MATNADIRNIFGLSVTTAYVLTFPYGAFVAQTMCESIAQGFGLSSSDGDNAYSYFSNTSQPTIVNTFNQVPFTNYLTLVKDIITSSITSINDYQANLLTNAAQSMIFAFAVNPCMSLFDFQKLMGKVLDKVASSVGAIGIFTSYQDIIYTPFSSNAVLLPLVSNDYSQVISKLSIFPQTIETTMTNYNWYDVSRILHGPDLRVMQDVENQYYYLSGVMMYESMLGTLEDCIEDNVTINTWTGQASTTYIRNVPCKSPDSYIGPVPYVQFNRIFNDGPSSSGYMTTGIIDFYMANDYAMLTSGDYITNAHNMFLFTGGTGLGPTLSFAFTDANGPYDLIDGDYVNVTPNKGCGIPYQSMHIGSNTPYYYCDSICTCNLQTQPRFKYANVELPDEIWLSNLQFRQTNPISDVTRIRKRAWSVNDNPYVATPDGNGVLWPYTVDTYSHQYWYAGYPQLNGIDALPQLAFLQSFYSPTFGSTASIMFYPCISTANPGTTEGGQSYRSYSTGQNYIYSGQGDLPIQFVVSVSSNMSGQDLITKKFYGMGDAFSGQYNINLTQEQNAGFFYTGFTVMQSGQLVNAATLTSGYQSNIIGQYPIIQYISGYKRNSDGAIMDLSNSYCSDTSGNLYTFAYFNQTQLGVSYSSWPYFAPVPAVFEAGGYTRIYNTQTVESYLPRFYDGPFSVETRFFLYPQAQSADIRYQGKRYGIPSSVSFTITIREETVREIFAKYQIYPDGGVSQPIMVNALRSDVMNPHATVNPKMTHIFHPDDSVNKYFYDFNNWGVNITDNINTIASFGPLVDNNWAPAWFSSGTGPTSYVPVGRNNNIYSNSNNPYDTYAMFSLGLRKTWDDGNPYINYLTFGSGRSVTLSYAPNPRNDVLFHGYNAFQITGQIQYVLPIFNLAENAMDFNQAMQSAFPDVIKYSSVIGTPTSGTAFWPPTLCRYRGNQELVFTGEDPLFFEFIGGRKGSAIAAQQGGYHSQGIIGDRWMGLVYKHYGMEQLQYGCGDDITRYMYRRIPGADEKLVLLNTDISGTDIWINGMSFNPYHITRNTAPLNSNMQFPYAVDGVPGFLTTTQSGQFVNFDISQFFQPLKAKTWITDQWYYQTGLVLGPFDRDIEIGIVDGQIITGYTEVWVNGESMSHYTSDTSYCDQNYFTSIGRTYYLATNEPSILQPLSRAGGYSIITVIPAGETSTWNILSRNDPVLLTLPDTDLAKTHVGIPGPVFVSMRTHIPLDGNTYDSHIYSGESAWLDSSLFVGNGIPTKLRISHDGPSNIGGTYEFLTYSKTGFLYPVPTPLYRYTGMAKNDNYGNPIYNTSDTPSVFWRTHAINNGVIVEYSGVREGSRISFTISNVQVNYDVLPYQSYSMVVPSGNCVISGTMGYYGQADNCIFTEGFHLTNATSGDDMSELYNPQFISDVLIRISGLGLFSWPISTDVISPVLSAPSVMKQRLNELTITENQNYVYLLSAPPHNYNKLWWPALSDLETLNPGNTIESIPPGDGKTFTTDTMLFSAAQGQLLPNGQTNPNILRQYYVQDIFQTYDSVATDAMINSGQCITSGRGTSVMLSQDQMSGALAPQGTPLTFVSLGLV